ncbi:hypothetical protein [Mycolicibacter acidiphilus]|uniref:hypothetical protein n=1 Tax=Mycolicibacter acidiphilus TaxID=2835306 RepID=UPI0027DDA0A2|nr:hypothetical protein [Mycolicibacter acidiphilus]
MLTGSPTAPRERLRRRVRITAQAAGVVAALAIGVVGCTNIVGGNPEADSSAAPLYRASVSASEVTSSIRETERQQAMTTQAVRGSCGKFASASDDAIQTVNKYVAAFNNGGDIAGTAGPAADALNHSADVTAEAVNDKLSSELRDALNAYVEAARTLATAISGKAPISVYNARKDELNNARVKGMQLCKTF